MYCVNCGVKLADSERVCPLCGTKAYHPDIKPEFTDGPYPTDKAVPEDFKIFACFLSDFFKISAGGSFDIFHLVLRDKRNDVQYGSAEFGSFLCYFGYMLIVNARHKHTVYLYYYSFLGS